LVAIAHQVICSVCGKRFDRDKIPFRQTSSRRYAHVECAVAQETTKKQEDLDKEELEKYIMQLLKEEYISPRVRKQISQFITEYGYTYSGMRKALVYFYEVKHNDPAKANGGIGIIPYCYNQARDYYYSLWLAQQQNVDKVIDEYKPEIVEIRIQPPQLRPPKKRWFTFFEEEVDE
jgi:hypothetical protein